MARVPAQLTRVWVHYRSVKTFGYTALTNFTLYLHPTGFVRSCCFPNVLRLPRHPQSLTLGHLSASNFGSSRGPSGVDAGNSYFLLCLRQHTSQRVSPLTLLRKKSRVCELWTPTVLKAPKCSVSSVTVDFSSSRQLQQ
jgi:hypothetical protein